MPEVRRRRATATTAPVKRRRDRAAEIEEDEEELEDDDVEANAAPTRPRKAAKRPATRRRAPAVVEDDEEDDEEEEEPPPPRKRRRRPEPEPEEEDEEDEEDEDEDEEEEEPPPPPRRKKAAVAKKDAPRRRRPPADEEDEDEPAPRRARSATKKRTKVPLGVHTGLAGAEKVARAGGVGADRLTLGKQPELIKVLEKEPLASFRQHWIRGGPGGTDIPLTCAEDDCPMCDVADYASKATVFNVLSFPADGPPANKLLTVAIKAYKAFVAAATPRGKENPVFDKDFWAVTRSGTGQQSQTNFKPVKERDLEEDWDEIFDNFDIEDLNDIIDDAKENVYDVSIIEPASRKKLAEAARYAADEEE